MVLVFIENCFSMLLLESRRKTNNRTIHIFYNNMTYRDHSVRW